jgi:hypothetical protein
VTRRRNHSFSEVDVCLFTGLEVAERDSRAGLLALSSFFFGLPALRPLLVSPCPSDHDHDHNPGH